MYSAREDYVDQGIVSRYEVDRFSGSLGKHRWAREQSAISRILEVSQLEPGCTILDCPVGVGRWTDHLMGLAPSSIACLDVSETMLKAAEERNRNFGETCTYHIGVAEELPFADGSFDLVFCHALAKHLPLLAQEAMLHEFARVTKRYVVCSFTTSLGVARLLRHLRRAKGAVIVDMPWLTRTCAEVGLSVIREEKTSTVIGFERSFLLEKREGETSGTS